MTARSGAENMAPAIELRGISKAFGPVQANKGIDLLVPRGTNTVSRGRQSPVPPAPSARSISSIL